MVDWNRVGDQATCQMLAASGGVAASIAAGSAVTGQIWGLVGGGAGLLAATALSNHLGCNDPPNPDGPSDNWDGGCTEAVEPGCLNILYSGGDRDGSMYVTARKWLGSTTAGTYPNGTPKIINRWIDCDGLEQQDEEAGNLRFRGVPQEGSECASDKPPVNPPIPPVPVPDPDGGDCVFNVRVVDAYINGSGGMSIKYESCPTGADCPISECHYFWYHGDGTTQPAPPTPPGPDPIPPRPEPEPPCPDYQPILDDIKECACKEPEDPDFPVDLTAWDQEFKAVCDVDEDGNPLEVKVTSSGASKASEALVALANNQRLLVLVMQQHLNWKTPICQDAKPELKGDFVTIHFESAENSPGGGRPLRKLFRYRTQSTRSIGQLKEYWRLFKWNAGPYCVQHKGHSWGTPAVWAASRDEGKRVIQHAAREAGFDPDQIGEWVFSGSDHSRYGMSGEMTISTRLKGDWLTSRDGPSGF